MGPLYSLNPTLNNLHPEQLQCQQNFSQTSTLNTIYGVILKLFRQNVDARGHMP